MHRRGMMAFAPEGQEAALAEIVGPEAAAEVKSAPEAEKPEADKPRPEGWETVDFKADPPEKVEARFKRIYGQLKHREDVEKQLIKDNRALMERLSKIEKAKEDETRNASLADVEKRIAKANEEGNYDEAAKLTRFLAREEAAAVRPKETPKPKEQPAGVHPDAFVAEAWSSETDDSGKPVRPWARTGHPQNADAMELMAAVFEDPRYADKPVMTQLREMERRFKAKFAKPTASSVLDGSGDNRPGADKVVDLSNEQKAVARALFDHLKPADAYKAYQEGMKL